MRPLNVGIVGCGRITDMHAPGYLRCEDARIHTVCDLASGVAERRKQEWGAVRATTSFEDVLADPEIDLVEIITPHHLHKDMAVAACEAGKHVSLQKPMAMNVAECDTIIAAAEAAGVNLKVFENFVFHPPYIQGKELIADGAIGEPLSIRLRIGSAGKGGWPIPLRSWLWRLDASRCGGGPTIFDDGYHKFSLARWFMGRDFEKVNAWIDSDTPLDAPAMIRAKLRRLPGDGPKYAQIDFSFSPRMALPCDFWFEDFVEIVGERGLMWINLCSAAGSRKLFEGCEITNSPVFPPIVVFVDGRVTTYLEDISPDERNWSTSFVGSTKHFIQVMKDGGEPIYTGEEGKEITRYAMASHISAQENRDVYLDEVTTEAEEKGFFEIRTNFCNVGKDLRKSR